MWVCVGGRSTGPFLLIMIIKSLSVVFDCVPDCVPSIAVCSIPVFLPHFSWVVFKLIFDRLSLLTYASSVA